MFAYCLALLASLRADKKGISAMEYGVLAAGIVIAVAAGAVTLGGDLKTFLTNLNNQL
jgi:pilus assembly protein Flp/PilA